MLYSFLEALGKNLLLLIQTVDEIQFFTVVGLRFHFPDGFFQLLDAN